MPPQAICDLYKKYQKMSNGSVDSDLSVVDFKRGLTEQQKRRILPVDRFESALIQDALIAFKQANGFASEERASDGPPACTIYEHKDFPGEQHALPKYC
jgi:alkylated DNA repair protein alkB family protein 1